MLQLLYRDVVHIHYLVGVIILFPLLINLFHFQEIPVTTYIILLYLLLGAPFYYEHRNDVNRSLISLPIKRYKIVLSRYSLFIMTASGLLGYILYVEATLFDRIALHDLNNTVILLIYTFMYLVIAVAIPIYYLFDNFWTAYFMQFVLLIFGAAVFFIVSVTTIFEPMIVLILHTGFSPVFLGLFSLFILAFSYWCTCIIFTRKDF